MSYNAQYLEAIAYTNPHYLVAISFTNLHYPRNLFTMFESTLENNTEQRFRFHSIRELCS